ncbi:MAG: elongation factor P [Chloroflexi bacterium]|nr:elongation factor P [Chloroflexota bacterium]MDA8189340.1 elongation factor P [Dehalococcoidales bacterium]
MINAGELKKGLTIELDGELYSVVDYTHNKTGRGGAVVRLKLRSLVQGYTVEKTFPASEKFRRVYLEHRKVQYLYRDDDTFNFMDVENFEQTALSAEHIGDDVNYLKENMIVDLLKHDEQPLAIELPITVELEVTETEPGFKGDTATGGNKPAIVETGLKVLVPLFVNTGDVIRVDTRTGEYLERV